MEFILYFVLGVAIYVPGFYILDHLSHSKRPRSLNRILGTFIVIGVIYVLIRVSGADALVAVALLLAYVVAAFILNAIYRREIKKRAEHEAVDS